MRKKFFLSTIFAISCFMSAMAQKPVLYVEYFSYNSSISAATVEQIRSSVMTYINETHRVDLIDVASVPSLQVEAARRQSEASLGDETARIGEMKQAGATHILQGYVSQLSTERRTTEGSNPTTYYKAVVAYTLKVIDAETGKLLTTKDIILGRGFGDMANGSSPDEAVTAVLKSNRKKVGEFIDENFKLKAVVLGEEFTVKGDEIETCVITLGSDNGIEKGQPAEVFVVRMVAGRESQKLIGSLKVTEVLAGDLSQCKVIKGGKEMKTAMDEYLKVLAEDSGNARPLTVTTKTKKRAIINF